MPLQEANWLHPAPRRLVGAVATLPDEPPRVMDVSGWGLAAPSPSPLLRAARRVPPALASTAGTCA
jgi:hypothetical protein